MMDHTFCPGSKLLRQPAPEFFDCPYCGTEVEIWTDELKRNCPGCKRPVYRDSTMSCLDWCKRGKECVGEDAYDRYVQNKCIGLKESLIARVRDHFGDGQREARIAESTAEFAELLLRGEQADWNVVVPASILWVLAGESEADNAVVRDILFRLGLKLDDIHAISAVIASVAAGERSDDPNVCLFQDAVRLALTREGEKLKTRSHAASEELLTETARQLATREFVP